MANANLPFGLIPLKDDGKISRVKYFVKSTATAIYPGDVVKLSNAGQVVVAAAADDILGIAAEYRGASETEIAVYDEPSCEYLVQCSGNFATADIGLNADFATGSADGLNRSGAKLDSSSFATTLGLPFKIVAIHSHPDNAAGSYAKVHVRLNETIFKTGQIGL